MSFTQILDVLMDAMGQQFYSLSVAMGIMIAYGSYMPDKTSLTRSIDQIGACAPFHPAAEGGHRLNVQKARGAFAAAAGFCSASFYQG